MHSVASSDDGHDSTGYSKEGRESLISSKKSLAESLSVSARLSNFKVSMAYESDLHKRKCGLCSMYFDRETVNYKVPNHRIFDLQNKWRENSKNAVKLDGRRYQSASFLYTETLVCTFCSQQFWLLSDELEKRTKAAKKETSLDTQGPKLDVVTQFQRADISSLKRSYQSSEVDGKNASFAVTPPFDRVSRTRREADPWWEVDLGRKFLVDKVSFSITIHVRQEFEIFVFLLERPTGFEDPFLDSVSSKSKVSQRFNIPPSDHKKSETIDWAVPSRAACFAIRIQLRGVHILELQHFQAFLGDEVILETDEDLLISANSYASLNPATIREGLKLMQSPDKRVSTAKRVEPKKDRAHINAVSHDAVKNLSEKIQARYLTLDDWKHRALKHSKSFSLEEIDAFYKVIFKYAAEMNKNNQDSSFNEHDLLDSALMEHYPRCNLQDLHHRLRAILRWIQTRSHLKILGALLHNETLNQMSMNSDDILYKLMSAIKRIEVYWDKKEEFERLNSSAAAMAEARKAVAKRSKSPSRDQKHPHTNSLYIPPPMATKIHEQRGCSWSQFLVLMSLVVRNRCEEIALEVFRIENPHVALPSNVGDDLLSANSGGLSTDGRSVSTFEVSQIDGKTGKARKNKMSTSRSLEMLTNRLHSPGVASPLRPSTQQRQRDDIGLLETVRKDSKMIPFDSRFSEYKLNNLLRRSSYELSFPKELDLTFAKQLIPKRVGLLLQQPPAQSPEELVQSLQQQQEQHDGLHTARSDNHSHVSGLDSLDFNGTPLPARQGALQRSNTAKFSLLRSTSKLSRLISEDVVDPSTPVASGGHGQLKRFGSGGASSSSHNKSGRTLVGTARAVHAITSMQSSSSNPSTKPPNAQEEDSTLSRHGGALRSMHNTGSSANLLSSHGTHSLAPVREGHIPPPLTHSPSKSSLLHHSNSHGHAALNKTFSQPSGLLMSAPSTRPATASSINHHGQHGVNTTSSHLPHNLGAGGGGGRSVSTAGGSSGGGHGHDSHNRRYSSTPNPGHRSSANGHHTHFQNNHNHDHEETNDNDDDDDFDDDFDDEEGGGRRRRHRKKNKETKSIDFHRICALCELRLPRASVEYKVMRKHIVTLRASWDPNLVSKEVRQLDNTISMYNLVYVCAFCVQFFDPDFPDGIAYPTRLPSQVAHDKAQKEKLEKDRRVIEEERQEREKNIRAVSPSGQSSFIHYSSPRPRSPSQHTPSLQRHGSFHSSFSFGDIRGSSSSNASTGIAESADQAAAILAEVLSNTQLEEKEDAMAAVLQGLERTSDAHQNLALAPYYDTRYTALNVEVGEIFRRPATIDARKRAARAMEVARNTHHH